MADKEKSTPDVAKAPKALPVKEKQGEKPAVKPEEKQKVPEKKDNKPQKTDIEIKKDDLRMSKIELQKKRENAKEVADGKKMYDDELIVLEGMDGPGLVPPRPDQKMVKKEDYERSQKQLKEQENKTANALKEKHSADIEDAITSLDIAKTGPAIKKAIYSESLISAVDIQRVSAVDKKKALESAKSPDGGEVDFAKLTPEQIRIVQSYQAKQYLQGFDSLSEQDKKDPKKLQALAQEKLGVTDFTNKKNGSLLTEEVFFQQVKEDPTLLRGFIDSVKENGILVSGVSPDTEFGKSLLKISQGNIDEYMKLFPEETDIKKLSDIFGGSYADIVSGAPFTGLDRFQDSLKSVQTSMRSGELGGIAREDFKTDKEFQDAMNKASKEATGMDYSRVTSMVNKASRFGKISPGLKFLADLLAPLGAMMGGATGDFWREYLQQGNGGKDVAGGGFDAPGQKFDKLKNTTPDAFVGAAAKYLGWPYKYGADGTSKEKGIDCSQLVVNSLVDVGSLPKGFDTTATGFAQRSHRVGDTQGKKGDFLIMGAPSPHIAIIAEDPAPGSNTYKTIEAASGKGGVVYTQRTAGKSFQVYRNPFFEGNDITQNKQGTEKFEIAGTPVTVIPPANPKNLSDRNKNPLNIKSKRFPGDSKGHSICPSYEAGITIAVEDLQKKLNGQSDAVRRYTGGRNAQYVRDVIGTWAPESDGNDPDGYTRNVLGKMGFLGDLLKIPVSAVQNRIPELVVHMAKMEGCQATFNITSGGH